ncbi:MAG: HAMP domain-containing sensor histidine kinase, partial [Candidatus Moranbacteria bacterium]|nr:HAMP domain-containing sensor histidine kinase [Candidatus Moranbacteria bacterium]
MVSKGLINDFGLEFYGLFGMTFFMGVLAYLIVKFKAFNIKLLGAQALVATQVILIASQFAFIRNNTNRVLTAITLFLSFVFGYFLIKSVKQEVKQREELEVANREINAKNIKLFLANQEISEKKDELQKTSDKLAVANIELKKLDQAKTDFIARASHDLRGPLTSIRGYISMVEEGSYGEISSGQKDALGKTLTVIKNMGLLIEDLFAASKIESGGMRYEFGRWKIEDLCQEVIDTLYIKAKDNNLYLEYEKPEETLPELVIDGKVIREAISNLVDNAVKYCPAGGVTLALARAEKSGYVPPVTSNPEEKTTSIKGPVARITISDTGIGIPKEEIPH